jgi:cyclase
VKTVGFKSRTYVGDPFNIIRLFNEKEVDELCVLDIDATADGRSPDVVFLSALASECFMPLSYGGGISTVKHARTLIQLGIEKLVLRTHASDTLISEIASEFGSQAVIGCLDYREISGVRVVGRHGEYLSDAVSRMIAAGVGELILQSVDRDGARTGMD